MLITFHFEFFKSHLQLIFIDSSNSREDLSHPIHADNCVLTPSGKCLKEKPAYIWRDYRFVNYFTHVIAFCFEDIKISYFEVNLHII